MCEIDRLHFKDGELDFRLGVRAAIRGLWQGQTDAFTFVDDMVSTIRRNLTRAWQEGAEREGISPEDYTQEERDALEDKINGQFVYLPGFASDIIAGSKANGGKLGPLLDRGELWVNNYNGTVQQAQTMARKDGPTKWILGVAEHCDSCIKLNEKVKRASYWVERGILPRVPGAEYLDCRGYNCQCSLVPTTDPLSKGPLPSLP